MQPILLFHWPSYKHWKCTGEWSLRAVRHLPHRPSHVALNTSCNWTKKGTAAAAGWNVAHWYTPEWARAALPCWSFWATKFQTQGGLKIKSGSEPPQDICWQKRFCSSACKTLDPSARSALQLDLVIVSDRTGDNDSQGNDLLFPLSVMSVTEYSMHVPYHCPGGSRLNFDAFHKGSGRKVVSSLTVSRSINQWKLIHQDLIRQRCLISVSNKKQLKGKSEAVSTKYNTKKLVGRLFQSRTTLGEMQPRWSCSNRIFRET